MKIKKITKENKYGKEKRNGKKTIMGIFQR